MKSIRLLFGIAFIFICTNCKANNILINNITSVTGVGYVQLQFDLSWDNSWNNVPNGGNHDAAWVFFKFKDNDGTWHHLKVTGANNNIAATYTIQVPPDLNGVFIYRNSGSGTVTLTGVQVGVNNLPGNFDVKGFALEMVEIPVGDQYYLGDGIPGVFYSNGSGFPFLVNSNTITMGIGAGLLDDGIQNGPLSATFPIAYNSFGAFFSFYMMKHELSEGAYRDFLNTLTYTQQATRTTSAPNSVAGTQAMVGFLISRNGIQIQTPGINASTPAVYGCNLNNNGVFNEANDGEWIACGALTYMDLAAWLDWAALRPMSEMEFEKSCRGPLTPVAGENATGTVAAAAYSYPINNSGAANESVTYSGSVLNANITYTSTSPSGQNPLRVGIHATPFATRISAGAGYYGCLDLSGNIEEFTVTTSNAAGRAYTGFSGNGTLTASGDADVDFWPGINGNTTVTVANLAYSGVTGVTGAAGVITRGGAAGFTGANLNKVSYRFNPGSAFFSRTATSGGRGVKSF